MMVCQVCYCEATMRTSHPGLVVRIQSSMSTCLSMKVPTLSLPIELHYQAKNAKDYSVIIARNNWDSRNGQRAWVARAELGGYRAFLLRPVSVGPPANWTA